jgi:magnesium transporter
MRTYWNINNGLRTIDTWQSACWTQVTCPNDEDISFMIDKLNIPEYFIEDIRDKDERSRYEYEDGWVLIILRIPYVREVRSHTIGESGNRTNRKRLYFRPPNGCREATARR